MTAPRETPLAVKCLSPLLLLLAFNSAQAASQLVATRLTPQNIASLQPSGPDAIAGLGDWVLSNGTLCAAISDIHHETGFNPWGGTLIDLQHCGRADDQWTFQHALPNLDKDKPLEPREIISSQEDGHAAITVTSSSFGLQLRSRYQVDSNHPRQLAIKHELRRLQDGDAVNMFGLLVLHPHLSLTPYSHSTVAKPYSKGFNYGSLDRSDTLSMVEAMLPADIHVLVGSPDLSEISYGVHLEEATLLSADGTFEPLPIFQVTDPTYSFQGVLSRPPWFTGDEKLGLLELAQSRLMDIKKGETLDIKQRIYLGERADVASSLDQIFRGPVISGSVALPEAMIHIRDRKGTPLNIAKIENGVFTARLPQDAREISLSVHSASGIDSTTDINLTATDTQVGHLPHAPPAFVELPSSGPMRLIFLGKDGTPDPDFNDNLLNFTLDGQAVKEVQAANYISLAGIESDPRTVALRPGKYRLLATRGMAYGVTETEFSLKSGDSLALDIATPMRELAIEGWKSADLHVHSAPSFDSYMPTDERLRGFVAQGGDIMVATEHNVLVNYQQDVDRLGLSNQLKTVNGIELTGMARTADTPFTNGHLNIFPLSAKPEQFAGGLPPHEGRRLRSLYGDIQKTFGTALRQLNHPRVSDPLDTEGDNAYFDHLLNGQAYNPEQPLESDDNRSLIEPDPTNGLRDLDFDLLEIANGNDFASYEITRRDWFSLLAQGEKIVASANSDSHGSRQLIAMPQNYVKMAQPYSEAAFVQAVKKGQMIGTSGPLLGVYASTSNNSHIALGETINQPDFTLHVTIEAASWVPVEQLTVFVNGKVYLQQPVSAGIELAFPITTQSPGFVTVEVTGTADPLYAAIAPGFTPFAFSNPIYIDSGKE
ncbi:MAG: CehA/McbA family metallohydrolase [Halioglobus sp.]